MTNWSTAAIKRGTRVRQDHEDIDELIASIQAFGILQALTITPDGWLVCGDRRLEAALRLGLPTVPVLIVSHLSDETSRFLAEIEENIRRLPLAPGQAHRVYEQLMPLYASDARARQLHGLRNRPAGELDARAANFAGRARDQVAGIVGYSHESIRKITLIQQLRIDDTAPKAVRAAAEQAAAALETRGARIDREWRAVAVARDAAVQARAAADRLAAGTAAAPSAGGQLTRRSTRAFTTMLTDLDRFWERYDLDELAATLTTEQWRLARHWHEQTTVFFTELLGRDPGRG